METDGRITDRVQARHDTRGHLAEIPFDLWDKRRVPNRLGGARGELASRKIQIENDFRFARQIGARALQGLQRRLIGLRASNTEGVIHTSCSLG